MKRLEKTYYYKVLRALVCVCACAIYILGLSGCNPDEPMQEVTIPVSICLPVGEVYASQAPAQRVFGDPGTTEQFRLPNYLYFFVVKKGDDDAWKVWHKQTESVVGKTADQWAAKWEKKHYTGTLATEGDSIYQYNADLNILLGANGFRGEVYAIASAVPLDVSSIAVNDSRDKLLGLTFSFDGSDNNDADDMVNNLQHIYSTPCNYKNNLDDYYGSFYATQNVPHLNLLLYHVAAKVDLMWNVKEDLQSSVRISYIEASNLYQGPCKVFKPTENAIGDMEGSYNHVVLSSLSPGTQWKGREYFYVIPYRNTDSPKQHYPLHLKLKKYEETPSGGYYSKDVMTDIEAIWVPWIRGQININTENYTITP